MKRLGQSYTLFVFIVFYLHVPLFSQRISETRQTERSEAPDSTDYTIGVWALPRSFLSRLPFRGESQEYYVLFPGTVNQDYRGGDLLHVRGSRHDEIAYSIESIDIRNAYTGLPMFRVIPEALESIALHTSPSASTSHASAFFERRLRRGGPDYRFSLRGESDGFTPLYEKRLGTYSYGYANALLTAEGRIIKDNIRFFVAGEGERFEDRYRKFWDGFTIAAPEFEMVDTYDGIPLEEAMGVDRIVIRPGNIPEARSDRVSVNSIVTADFLPFQFRAVGLFDYKREQLNDTPIRDVFNPRRIPERKEHAGLVSLQADYAGQKDLNAHLQLDFMTSGGKVVDPLFGDDFLLYTDSVAVTSNGLPWGNPTSGSYSYYNNPPRFDLYYFDFYRPGTLLTNYSKWSEGYWSVSGSLEKAFGSHLLSVGSRYHRRTLRKYSIGDLIGFTYYFRKLTKDHQDLYEDELLFVQQEGEVDAFGYDVFGNQIQDTDEVNDAPRHPSQLSVYMEDQYHNGKILLEFGLRYDRFFSDSQVLKNPLKPEMESTSYGDYITVQAMKKSAAHQYFSPRLTGVFFANNHLAFHFHFGKYVQQARFKDVSTSRVYFNQILTFSSSYLNAGIRGLDAEPIRVSQTELGLSYRPTPKFIIEATLFYKVMENQLEIDRVMVDPDYYYSHYIVSRYLIMKNSGESIAKGLELSLQYRKYGLLTWMNYTLSDVRGYNSYPISNLFDPYYDYALPSKDRPMLPLEFNQKHRVNAMLSYTFDSKAPFWLRYTGAYALFRFNSGHDFPLFTSGMG
ncbi:MAG: TonB-dependent receptor [bacterium]